ncbi:MAG: hypothetical protein ACN6NW_13770 [Acinetobacter amyesii]|uniref:hypothetical protein n=1 Tax=Acinetobacter TaxID=469 RepID=UPI002A90F103|nr:hypothetical protein [Acinetobacter faecalis]MDY6488431.1 hypothetical protein [Acinetobacter faecalis]
MKKSIFAAGFLLAVTTLTHAATDGIYAIENGYYSINVKFEGDHLTIVEPNKTSVYNKQGSSEYVFTNPTNNITYGLRIINDSTLEAYKPGTDSPPTVLKLQSNRATTPVSSINSNRMKELADKYYQLSQTDSPNTQTWTQCAAVAMGYSTLSAQEAKNMEVQSATLLQMIQANPSSSSPCSDVISNSTWNSIPKY